MGNLEDFEPSIIAFSPTVLGKDPKPGFFIYHLLPHLNVTRTHKTSGWGHVLCTYFNQIQLISCF